MLFRHETENGIGRVEIDLGRGTWNGEVVRRDLERLTNPLAVRLAVGDDSGGETIAFRVGGPVWTYVR